MFEKKKPTPLERELAYMYLIVYDTGKTYTKKKIASVEGRQEYLADLYRDEERDSKGRETQIKAGEEQIRAGAKRIAWGKKPTCTVHFRIQTENPSKLLDKVKLVGKQQVDKSKIKSVRFLRLPKCQRPTHNYVTIREGARESRGM